MKYDYVLVYSLYPKCPDCNQIIGKHKKYTKMKRFYCYNCKLDIAVLPMVTKSLALIYE